MNGLLSVNLTYFLFALWPWLSDSVVSSCVPCVRTGPSSDGVMKSYLFCLIPLFSDFSIDKTHKSYYGFKAQRYCFILLRADKYLLLFFFSENQYVLVNFSFGVCVLFRGPPLPQSFGVKMNICLISSDAAEAPANALHLLLNSFSS